jgi:hypothetical protein
VVGKSSRAAEQTGSRKGVRETAVVPAVAAGKGVRENGLGPVAAKAVSETAGEPVAAKAALETAGEQESRVG